MKKGKKGALSQLFWAFVFCLAGSTLPAFAQTPFVYVTNLVKAVSEPSSVGEFLIVKDSGPDITVEFEMLGTAVLGVDYVIVGGQTSVVVPGSDNVASVRVEVLDNLLMDADRTISLRLLPGPGYSVGAPDVATVVVKSDDPSPFPAGPFDIGFELRPTPLLRLNPPLVAADSPLTIRFYATGPSAAVFLDSALIDILKPLSGYCGAYFIRTLTNLSAGLHQFAAVVNRTNEASEIGTLPIRVADALLPPTNQGTISNATLVGASLFTFSDNDPQSSGAYIEFPVPAGAANWKSALFMTAYAGSRHRLSTYAGDGMVTSDDVMADAELVTTFTPSPINTPMQFDVTHWTRSRAGGYIGFKLQVDPADQPIAGATFNNAVLALFSETNDVPTHLTWLNFPTNAVFVADEPVVINLELSDPDSRITGVRISEVPSGAYGPAARSTLAGAALDFPPGTNFVSLVCSNLAVGQYTFEVQVTTESAAVNTFSQSVMISPGPVTAPAHRWLGSNGESKSFYVVDASGRAWVWGDNANGQLGLGFRSSPITRPVSLAPPAGKTWRQFTSASYCAVGVTDDGKIYGMGTNTGGASIGKTSNPNIPLPLPMGTSISARRAGLAEDSLWIINDRFEKVQMFKSQSSWPSPFLDLATGGNHVLAVDSSSRVSYSPTDTGFAGYVDLATPPWKSISTCATHSVAIDATGKLFAWGPDTTGTLPFFSNTNLTRPQLAGFPAGVTAWMKVAAGKYVSLVVDQDGRLWSWGKQGYTGSAEPYVQSRIVLVAVPGGETNWLDVAVGSSFAMALSARGDLYVWGDIPASPSPRHLDFPELVTGLPNLLSPSAPAATLVTFEPTSIGVSSQIKVDLIAPAGSNLAVETSPDLANWTIVTNIANSGPKSTITAPIPVESNLFFRVR